MNNEYLLAIPREQTKIEINQDVLEFIEYLTEKEKFDKNAINDFLILHDMGNKKEYEELFSLFAEEKLIIPVA